MDKYERERKQMVKTQIIRRGLREPQLLAAFEVHSKASVCAAGIPLRGVR